jgi:hypothetical protein
VLLLVGCYYTEMTAKVFIFDNDLTTLSFVLFFLKPET